MSQTQRRGLAAKVRHGEKRKATRAMSPADMMRRLLRGEDVLPRGVRRRRWATADELLVRVGWTELRSTISDACHRIVVHRRLGAGVPLQRLNQKEFGVAELGARGLRGHQIARLCKLPSATARGVLVRSTARLHLQSPVQLPLFWATLSGPHRVIRVAPGEELAYFESPLGPLPLDALTALERDLVMAVLMGDSNQDVATRRGVSIRTVANQIAKVFRKLAVSSRRELSAKLARSLSP
jgi:DNA-binding CsgD family transcriptional regulator